jgi:NADPH:quinone reductase-like Zn-dependent oxidoreductase
MNSHASPKTSRVEKVALAGWLALLLATPGPVSGAQAQTMRQYQFDVVDGAVSLAMKEVERPVPGANEVLVRVRATSLNRRDLSILESQYGGGSPQTGLVPLSDGAGEVIGVGPGVSRFAVGDRVAGIFFERWIDGRPSALTNASARGGAIDGMLSEMIVSHEDGLVEIPEHLSFEEAATLPCAGVTAWNALFKHGGLAEDDFVLLEGTGGVSIFGLQFSVATEAIAQEVFAKLREPRPIADLVDEVPCSVFTLYRIAAELYESDQIG